MAKKKLPKAFLEDEIKIGNVIIPCAVLEDGIRVLTLRGVFKALGRSRPRGKSEADVDEVPAFLRSKALRPFITKEILASTQPIEFIPKHGGLAHGFKAEVLPMICNIFLEAREKEELSANQLPIAEKCEILMRGFAHIGIIALIDEATGYEHYKSRKELENILDQFIAKELRKWSKTFPDEFYKEMFRLRDWRYIPWSVKRPGAVGKYTNDLVYARLAPGILNELRRLNPKNEKGRRKVKFFQWLTRDIGHPALREHINAVMALMRASANWRDFERLLRRAFPKYPENLQLLLELKEKENKLDQ